MNTQQRIIASLFVLSIILLAANIIVGKIFETENTIITPSSLSANEIDSLLIVSINNFGLPVSTIKSQKVKEINISSDYPSYSIQLPADLPIPVFISELNEIFSGFDVQIITDEKKKSGRTLLRINSDDEIRLAASIDYNAELQRKIALAGFLISINDKTSKADIDKLLKIPEPFAFLFKPSLVMKSFITSNSSINRQFAIILGDETEDLDYKFESGYSERRLKSSVRNLLGSFSKAAFFVIDDNSSFYNSKVYPFVEKEFLDRKLRLIKKSELNFISGNISSAVSQFNELMTQLENNSSILIGCNPEDFISLLNEIRNYRKIGYKYIVPSEILNQIN